MSFIVWYDKQVDSKLPASATVPLAWPHLTVVALLAPFCRVLDCGWPHIADRGRSEQKLGLAAGRRIPRQCPGNADDSGARWGSRLEACLKSRAPNRA
jgi:hypothetical protein